MANSVPLSNGGRYTLHSWMVANRIPKHRLQKWLWSRGIGITDAYLNDLLTARKVPGPVFLALFRDATGVSLRGGSAMIEIPLALVLLVAQHKANFDLVKEIAKSFQEESTSGLLRVVPSTPASTCEENLRLLNEGDKAIAHAYQDQKLLIEVLQLELAEYQREESDRLRDNKPTEITGHWVLARGTLGYVGGHNDGIIPTSSNCPEGEHLLSNLRYIPSDPNRAIEYIVVQ